MNESRPNQKSPFRPMMMILVLIIVVPLLLCGGVLTWFFGRQSVASKELAIRVEQLRQDGMPVDSKSLQAKHESLTSDEFSKKWSEAVELASSKEFREQVAGIPVLGMGPDVPLPGDPWPQQDEVTAFLKEWESLSELIHEAAQANLQPDQLPTRRTVEFGDMGSMTESQESRTLARLIALEFDVALHQMDGDRAFRCLQTSRGIQRSFDGEPILISQLIRVAVGMITNGMLRRALKYDLLSESQLAEVSEQIPTFQQTHKVFVLAMQGERAFGLTMFTDPDKMASVTGAEPGSKLAGVLAKLRSIDGLAYLDEMETIVSFPSTSLTDFRKAGLDWQKDMENQTASAGATERTDKAMTYTLVPAIGAAIAAFVREAENNNLARLAIATRHFRNRFDRWPQELVELEKMDLDPRSLDTAGAEPFGYLVESPGVVIWGIERSRQESIPDQPPLVDSEGDANAPWVWRLVDDEKGQD